MLAGPLETRRVARVDVFVFETLLRLESGFLFLPTMIPKELHNCILVPFFRPLERRPPGVVMRVDFCPF